MVQPGTSSQTRHESWAHEDTGGGQRYTRLAKHRNAKDHKATHWTRSGLRTEPGYGGDTGNEQTEFGHLMSLSRAYRGSVAG
jgi:hypothetical protein